MNIQSIEPRLALLSIGASAFIAACGGGGGSNDAGGGSGNGDLTITGTAATGAAIGSAGVEAKCANGNGSTTSGADGRFSMTVTGGVRPCALRVANGSSFLHSLVEAGSGASATANITPLSELLAGQTSGGAPSDWFGNFDAAAQAKASAAAVAAAKADLVAALKARVDLTGLDPLTTPLAVGDALDQKLDALAATLTAAGLSLDDLRAVLVANPGSPAPVASVIAPRSAACGSLRSGRYRALNPLETDPAFRAQVTEFDAPALKATESDGTVTTFTDAGHCSFTTATGTLLVSRGGMSVFRSNSPAQMSVIIPEQSIGLAELAGTWNYASYLRSDSSQPFAPSTGYFTLDGAGKFSAHFDCVGRDTCTDQGSGSDLTVNASDGGFDRAGADGTRRVFVFKTPLGGIAAVTLAPGQRGIVVATKQAANVLPAVGDVTKSQDVVMSASGAASISADDSRTVTAVDTATQSYTRVWTSDGRTDGFSINSPRTGVFYRAPGLGTTRTGTNVNILEILLVPLPGGVSAFTSVTAPSNFFGLSVGHL